MNRRRLGLAVIVLLVCAGTLYAKKHKPAKSAEEQKRALHALDRLTFGPRPGDVQAVMAIGVDKWIDQQLHPERIDDSAMQARLAQYRTLQMGTREMVLAFPPNPVVKAVANGKLAMPGDAYRRAIYTAAIDRYQQKQDEKQQSAASGGDNSGAAVQAAELTQRQLARREARSMADDLGLLPPPQRMQRILAMPPAEQRDLLQGLGYPKRQALLAGLAPEQRETVIALNHPEAVVDTEVQSAKLLRAVYSQRQLEEVLTDFWVNHFNVFIGKGADRYLVTAYERDVIRPHVLGKFKDLLVATAQSPAMLFYLDNWQSEGPDSDAALGTPVNPNVARRYPQLTRQQNNQQKRRSGLNENYARELMELHTLGVNGGYTQQDVTEVARVFTGWTLETPQQGGGFIFRPRLHEPGDKMVLGHRIKENGEQEGLEVLDLLAHQPATARFISRELAQRFLSDDPPQSLIDSMSKTFLKTDGDIREVLRTMFQSKEFWAPQAYNARVKTPFEFVASALRATDADISDPMPLIFTLNKMGQPLYGCQPPTGYSTRSDGWVNSAALLDRMNFGLALASNRLPGTSFDLSKLLGAPTSAPATAASDKTSSPLAAVSDAPFSKGGAGIEPENVVDPYQVQIELEQVLLAGDVSRQTHETIEQHIVGPVLATEPQDSQPKPNITNINVIAGLLLGSPEFQRK